MTINDINAVKTYYWKQESAPYTKCKKINYDPDTNQILHFPLHDFPWRTFKVDFIPEYFYPCEALEVGYENIFGINFWILVLKY